MSELCFYSGKNWVLDARGGTYPAVVDIMVSWLCVDCVRGVEESRLGARGFELSAAGIGGSGSGRGRGQCRPG